MDNLPKTKIKKVNKRTITQTKNLLINYVEAKTPELKDKHFIKLKEFLLKRKSNEIDFDINQELGFWVNYSGGDFDFLGNLAIYKDDDKLFRLVRELGLSDMTSEGIAIWYGLLFYKSHRCLKEYLSNIDFKQIFAEGKSNPIHVAIAYYNLDALKMLCSHLQFDKQYLTYKDSVTKKNALCYAATHFNTDAIKLLLDIQAPCISPNEIPTAFDLMLSKFMDFYSNDKLSAHMRKKAGLDPLRVSETQDKIQCKVNDLSQVVETFYLLLGRTPQTLNVHQFWPMPKSNQNLDIFKILSEIQENAFMRPAVFKILVDIILSVGPGLNFYDLPILIQNLYPDRPVDAQIVMPVFLSNQKVSYIFTRQAFEKFLRGNVDNIKPIGAIYQYVKQKLSRLEVADHADNFLITVKEIITDIHNGYQLEKNIIYPSINPSTNLPIIPP